MTADPRILRTTFDTVPAAYDCVRPAAPPGVLDDLVRLARLRPGDRLLEIGCGTGQATLPLAERGYEIVAVELGEQLADLAREKLARFPRVAIVTSSFEEWDAGEERFDAVVSFNAFHWIDPEVRFSKPASVLRDDGALAVYGTSFVVHDGADPGWLALQEDYEAVTGARESLLHVDDLRDRSDEFTEGGHFARPTLERYFWDIPFNADRYVALLGTISSYNVLEAGARKELFARIRRRIQALPDGTITPTMTGVLYVAQRA